MRNKPGKIDLNLSSSVNHFLSPLIRLFDPELVMVAYVSALATRRIFICVREWNMCIIMHTFVPKPCILITAATYSQEIELVN